MATTVPSSPVFISSDTLCNILTHRTLIDHFQSTLPNATTILETPIRQHYPLSPSSSLLLMPSWSSSPSLPYAGVKLVTHFPQNSARNLPGVQGTYVLFSSATGQTLAAMDSTHLTLYRTACVSVFVDNEAALVEAGELLGAFQRGVITRDHIQGTLVDLVSGLKVGRKTSHEITVFKSVGSAVVDMLAAQFVYETYTTT
uniref:Uncharacterized protein P11E10.01 n=1 Tax=Cajanus cajan TaxID=3821 RepID=A0A151U6F3_CAJCA|nr:Uncharacterized protein P11E10.01 [Cajanus cajan]